MNAPSQNTALVALERQLEPLSSRFAAALAGAMPVERLIRTVMVSVERLPALLTCDRQSIMMAAMSAACLGLEVDGVTGQAFLIPFKGRAQLVIGYKGFNTLAARSGITITGGVVREGDSFEYEKGSAPYVRHKPSLAAIADRRIIGAWAAATHRERPPVVEVLGIDELMAVKAKSPGAKRNDSPWNDVGGVGFAAMCEKTAKRRLARSLPMSVVQQAARLDAAADEEGRAAWITPDRGLEVEVEGEAVAATPYEDSPTPVATQLLNAPDDVGAYIERVRDRIGFPAETAASLHSWWASPAEKQKRQQLAVSAEAARRISEVAKEVASAIESRKAAA